MTQLSMNDVHPEDEEEIDKTEQIDIHMSMQW